MFKEILNIIPRLGGKELNAMERTLNQRFMRVAKKFGGGLVNVLKGGGIAGIAISLIDKVLNPLKEVQEAIDKSLQGADQLTTNAGQFGTTSGKLFRLQQLAGAKGLDADSLAVLITKFQTAVAEAKKDPTKKTAVSAFVGKTDTAEAFFEFIQSLQKMDKTAQTLVQQEVFGEKQILKMSEFLQTDFQQLARQIGGPSAEELTHSIEKIGVAEDLQAVLKAQRETNDIVKKAQLITPRTVVGLAAGEKAELDRENKRLAQFDDLKKISMATDKLVKILEDSYLKLAPVLSKILPMLVNDVADAGKAIGKSRFLRGMTKGKDD